MLFRKYKLLIFWCLYLGLFFFVELLNHIYQQKTQPIVTSLKCCVIFVIIFSTRMIS